MMKTPDVNLIKTLIERAEAHPDRIYVKDIDERAFTYSETLEQIRRRASAWQRLDIDRGAHVVTMQHNTIESMFDWLALAWLGAIEAPINNDYRGLLLVHALNLTRAPLMTVLSKFVSRIAEVADQLKYLETIIVLDADEPPDLPFKTITGKAFGDGAEPATKLNLPAPWDIMAILFTSGTTGPSKAVRLPWAQIHAMATGTFPLQDLGPADVIYNPGPTYHVGAKVWPYLAALCGGHHVMRPFISSTQAPIEYIKHGITIGTPVVPWMAEPDSPHDKDVPLRNVLAPYKFPPAMEGFVSRFGGRRFGCFNMTEVSCPIIFRDWDSVVYDEENRMSCGAVRPGYEVRIVDENDQELPPGTIGELIIRADTPWVLNAGYLNQPEATAESWRNGWFHTGDALTCDEKGNYYFIDRIKDCIRRRGENISSFEVEEYVGAHPSVMEVAAVGVRKSNQPAADEEVKVVIVPQPDVDFDPGELIKWLIPRMPRFMVPRYVELTDSLPRTPTMKVQKKKLRDVGLTKRTWDRESAGIEIPRL